MKKNILFILVLFLIISCDKTHKDESNNALIIKPTMDTSNYNLIKNIVNKGDKEAYKSLFIDYSLEEKSEDLFFVSFLMANRYSYSDAYYDLYATLVHSNLGTDFDKLDEKTKCFALYFLLKAKEKGDEKALNEAHEIFKDKKIPSAKSYLLKLAED
ncbi:MAG: hypothetical protein Q7W45_07815 [Bacteroidota bacterium]|nr:hypothetical protein [Bacteroidota bacterium]MDP3146000.1 hypothetical protein [Bacteroidota bacterium]